MKLDIVESQGNFKIKAFEFYCFTIFLYKLGKCKTVFNCKIQNKANNKLLSYCFDTFTFYIYIFAILCDF